MGSEAPPMGEDQPLLNKSFENGVDLDNSPERRRTLGEYQTINQQAREPTREARTRTCPSDQMSPSSARTVGLGEWTSRPPSRASRSASQVASRAESPNVSRRYSMSVSDLFKAHQYKPPLHQFLSSHHSVTNTSDINLFPPSAYALSAYGSPGFNTNGLFHEAASIHSEDRAFRPSRLIGTYKKLCNWIDFYKEGHEIIKNKLVREYYDDQNNLILKFQEIDNFLDAGRIHYNVLDNYDSVPMAKVLLTLEEAEEESMNYPKAKLHVNPSPPNGRSRIHEIPGNIDYEGAQFLGYNEAEDGRKVLVAILVNFFINFVLLIGKVVVSLMTNSMSVVASLVDSILDFLSTFIIYIANRLTAERNWKVQHAYPVGRSRLEPLGVLVFSVIIIISFFQVGQESFKQLLYSESHVPVTIGANAIAIMLVTIFTKIGAWIWCSKSKSSSVKALAQDAMTDIVFNTVSLLMPSLGYYFNIWWLDPLGALLLSIYVISSWCMTAFEHIDNLTGAIANQMDYKIVLYLAYRFAEPIKQITSLKVYHVGDNCNVEIDVVFAYEEFNLSFKDCHDIAEALQYSIETLPMVERAFVHIDYMEGNFKGHLK